MYSIAHAMDEGSFACYDQSHHEHPREQHV